MNNIWVLRVLSFLLALVLYFFVHNQSNSSEIALVVPVELQNIPEKRIVLLPENRQAKVTLRGPSFLMSDLVSKPPSFKIKLPEGVDSRVELALKPESLALNSALEVVSIDPPKLELVMDQLEEKILHIDVPRIGGVPEGFKLISINVEPGKVLISGAATELQNINGLETYPVDIRALTESATREMPLRNPGKYTKLSIDRVRVDIQIEALSQEKVFEDIPISFKGNIPNNLKLSHPAVRVEISGDRTLMQTVEQNQIKAYVDFTKADLSNRRLNIGVDLPQGISLVMVEPKTVRILNK